MGPNKKEIAGRLALIAAILAPAAPLGCSRYGQTESQTSDHQLVQSVEASTIEGTKATSTVKAKPGDIIEAVEIRSAPAVQTTPIVIEQYKPPTITFDEIKTLYGKVYPAGVYDKDRSEGVYYWPTSDEKVVMVWGKVKEIKAVEKTRPIADGLTMTSIDQVVTLGFGDKEITVPIKESGAWTAQVVNGHVEEASSDPVSPEQVVKEIKAAGSGVIVDARLDFTNGDPKISFVGIYPSFSSR